MTPALHQFLGAPVLNPGQIALGLQVGELRALLPGIELDQNVAFLYRLARLEVNLVDGSRQIGANRDPLNRRRRTNHR